MKKVLILRFSSIGDIILTTPVIRCVKEQMPGVKVHFLTKQVFSSVLNCNPYIDEVITFSKDVSEVYKKLHIESYDYVIDLHNNLRTFRLKRELGKKSYAFNKLNIAKFLAVNFKMRNVLPSKHIVERYLETVKPLGVNNDHKGLDFYLEKEDKVDTVATYFKDVRTKYIALVIGGSYYTKQIPLNKLFEICASVQLPIILLGGKEDSNIAKQIVQKFPDVINACGIYSINQSASLIEQAEWVISSDTGLMHIASAFNKKIISVWGNTIPEFGMAPYLPVAKSKIIEVSGLSCRPCSKLGYKKCPKGHFKCMNEIDFSFVEDLN